MTGIQDIIARGTRLARLTNIALLVSLLFLPGYLAEGGVRQPQRIQTEFRFSFAADSKSTVEFRYSLMAPDRLDYYGAGSEESNRHALLCYNNDTQTRLKRHSQRLASIRKYTLVFTSRYTLSDPDARVLRARPVRPL